MIVRINYNSLYFVFTILVLINLKTSAIGRATAALNFDPWTPHLKSYVFGLENSQILLTLLMNTAVVDKVNYVLANLEED